jgi:peptide/nickel transport system substrate-binding protein
MKKILILGIILVVTAFVFGQVSIPREETVYCIGAHWGAPTGWNLYGTQVMWGTEHFFYPPLFYYSTLKDEWLPFIAEGFEFLDVKTLRIKIRDEAKWSDGQPITAYDVEYTLNLTKELNLGPGVGWWDYIEYVKAVDDKVVEFKVKGENPNYFSFINYSFAARPVPKHVYENLEKQGVKIREWMNNDPDKQVVSGPYKLFFADQNNIIYQRIDNWWGKDLFGLPAPKYIAHVIYKDNAASNLAFERGDADWASTFIPAVYDLWKKKNLPIRTWFGSIPYYMPDGVNFLYINYKKAPLNDPVVRKAIAFAIPFKDMLEKAYFSYSVQAHPSMVIDYLEAYKKWIDYDLAKATWGTEDGRVPYDLEMANKLLDEAGYKKGKDGIRVAPDGTRLGTYTIQVPYGWTDWMMMCDMISKNLKKIGIDVVTEFPDFSVWWDRLINGNFDFVISWDGGPGFDHPWNTYRFVMDQRLTGPINEPNPAGDWQRYENPEVTELLDMIPSTLDMNERKKAYSKLQEIAYRDIPAIPLFYGAHWYAFSEKYWTNWPREENPFWYPAANWSNNALPLLFGLAKKGEKPVVPSWLTEEDKGGLLMPTSKIFDALVKAQ